jgi:hypothetical protein
MLGISMRSCGTRRQYQHAAASARDTADYLDGVLRTVWGNFDPSHRGDVYRLRQPRHWAAHRCSVPLSLKRDSYGPTGRRRRLWPIRIIIQTTGPLYRSCLSQARRPGGWTRSTPPTRCRKAPAQNASTFRGTDRTDRSCSTCFVSLGRGADGSLKPQLLSPQLGGGYRRRSLVTGVEVNRSPTSDDRDGIAHRFGANWRLTR